MYQEFRLLGRIIRIASEPDWGAFSLIEDRELIRRAQNGDKDAFAEIVQKYHKAVYSLAYRLTGNRDDAMDATQETFYRVFRGLGSFDLEKPFLPWAYRITWNFCIDRGRKKGRTPVQESLDDNEIERTRLAGPDPSPEKVYEDKELKLVLSHAIEQLKDGYKELIVLFHLEGFSIREISEITGMKETVIKNRLYRGRQALRKILEDSGFAW